MNNNNHIEWQLNINIKDGFDVVIGNPPYIQIQSFSGKKEQRDWQSQKFETFNKNGDIYSLFYERGFKLLNKKGILTYITSSKWMRAEYGENTRQFFSKKTNPILIIDFGMELIFESVATLTNILILQNKENQNKTKSCRVIGDFKPKLESIYSYFLKNYVEINDYSSNSWIVYAKHEYNLINKVKAQGTFLKDWNLSIYRGVLTGFNEAFIIGEQTKNELLEKDSKNIEILKKIVRGRDIRKYFIDYQNLYLINTHNGSKEKNIKPINVEKNYYSIFEFLKKYENKLIKRTDKGDHWSNLRNCAYLQEFEKPKIIYPNMTKFLPFVYDETGFYTNQKCFIITGDSLKYLVAIFNSEIFKFAFKDSFPELLGNTYELSKVFFEKLPIKKISEIYEKPFIEIVDQILEKKKLGENTQELENKIDQMVYELYELTPEEIAIVEKI